MLDGEFDGVGGAAVVNGTQGMETRVRLGYQAVASQLLGGGQQVAQEPGRESGHVAGHH